MLTYRQSGRQISRKELAALEDKFDFEFPSSFVNFYLKTNGGYPSSNLFKFDDEILVVSLIFPIEAKANGFEDVYSDLNEILPKHLIPFAHDPGGDFYCFSKRSEDFGSIWIFRGEYDEPEWASRKICASVDDFLNGLEPDE